MSFRSSLLIVGILATFGRAAAADTEPPGKLVVDFAPPESGAGWFVSALEEMVARELSRFAAVQLAEKLDARRCPTREPRCLVDAYRTSGVQVVVLGKLRKRTLQYEIYETWTGTRASDGSLKVAGESHAELQRHVGELVRPIVQRGGLLDQRPTPPAAPTPAPRAPKQADPRPAAPAPPTASSHPHLLTWLLLATMVFFAWPVVLARLLVGARELRKRGRPASWKWSAALLAALAVGLMATAIVDVRALLVDSTASAGGASGLLLPVVAGMLWGTFVLVNAGWVFSPIHGLGHTRHDVLWPLLRSWLALSCLRAALLLLYAPILLLTLLACRALELPQRVTLALALPAAGLLVYFWLLTLVDNLSLFLDVQLVIGPATARNPWHATIKRYFRGYVRRNGVDLDSNLLERTLFLPSLLPNVVSYGGGFGHPRILVGEQVREAALGELPEEDEVPERTVNPEELPYGFLVPATQAQSERDWPLQAKAAEQRRRELALAPARARGAAPRLLGENATLLGWVTPQSVEEGIPLISNNSEDFDVVKRLLTEHYAAFERNLDEDEVDDTDPTQKDFLFGALIREMGVVASHDTFLATIRYGLALAAPRRALWPARLLIRGLIAFYERFLAGPAAKVADAHAALNYGLHHLIQYLCFMRGVSDDLLTARANAPRLIRTSVEMLERLGRAAYTTVERQLFRATPRNRLRWLSQFFHAPLGARPQRQLRVLGAMVFALVVGSAIGLGVREAIAYHPIYVERMQSQSQGAAPDERPPGR